MLNIHPNEATTTRQQQRPHHSLKFIKD